MRHWAWLLLVACTDGPTDDPVPAGCDGDGELSFEFGQDLSTSVATDGEPISYGTPPQGGAPYAPFQIRMKAPIDAGARLPIVAVAEEVGTGVDLGFASQAQAFICSNTGVHEGWLYGGEVHLRFSGWDLADLEGREVEVTLEIDEVGVESSVTGVLAWDL